MIEIYIYNHWRNSQDRTHRTDPVVPKKFQFLQQNPIFGQLVPATLARITEAFWRVVKNPSIRWFLFGSFSCLNVALRNTFIWTQQQRFSKCCFIIIVFYYCFFVINLLIYYLFYYLFYFIYFIIFFLYFIIIIL